MLQCLVHYLKKLKIKVNLKEEEKYYKISILYSLFYFRNFPYNSIMHIERKMHTTGSQSSASIIHSLNYSLLRSQRVYKPNR